jgi:DNA (cytosine-5)-methyltransferase 1
MLEYLRMADELKPKWIVWENVVGVLSSNGGRDFGTFITALGKIGYGFAYRVLDAQYFGVPQRRRRVFVVGCLGDWRSAGKVLFESESLSGNPPPSRKKGERVAPTVTTGPPYARTGNDRVETEAYVTFARVGHGHYSDKNDIASTVRARDYKDATDLVTQYDMKVRRLTPKECERLQGFPDDWTKIEWRGKKPELCPDAPRYKAMGNSMAVPVMRWIGQQIKQVEEEEKNG